MEKIRAFLRLAVVAFLTVPLAAQTMAPHWYIDKEFEYPADEYISAVGEGTTHQDAQTQAVAGISLFFNTQAEVRNEAIREFNETISNNTTNFSSKTYVKDSAVIKSEEEFLGVHFASPWFDQKNGRWATLAYINRREAADIYEAKISANMASISLLVTDAAQEKEPLYVCGLLFKAIRIGDITEEYIKTAAVVDSQSGRTYASHLSQIQSLRQTYRTKRDNLTFAVTASSSDFTGRVERKVQELLEENGYTITERNPQYTVAIKVSTSEEEYDAGMFVRSGITVRLERSGKALFSYSKNYPREGHKTIQGAYNRAFLGIERDLEENFLAKLTAMVGK